MRKLSEDEYTEPLDEVGKVYPLISIGDKVTTPDGPGEVIDIALNWADYGDRQEMEPPIVTVQLKDGQELATCMCSVELEDEELTDFLQEEYRRLWPPVEELPGNAESLVDDEKLEQRVSFMRKYLRPGRRTARLEPGQVVKDLEGVDVGSGAVVLDVTVESDGQQKVKLFLQDSKAVQEVKLPGDSAYREEGPKPTKEIEDTVYDPAAVGQGYGVTTRGLPDSYLAPNPNYPSSMSDALWRPTYRQTPPFRYYAENKMKRKKNRRSKRAYVGYDHGYTHEKDDPYLAENDWLDVSPEESIRIVDETELVAVPPGYNQDNPIRLFDPNPGEDYPIEFFNMASLWWEDYQTYRHKKVPGITWSHENAPFADYSVIFMKQHCLDIPDMRELIQYMVDIGFMGERELRQFNEMVSQDQYRYRKDTFENCE